MADYNVSADPAGHSNVIAVDSDQIWWQRLPKLEEYIKTVTAELTEIGKAWQYLQIRWEGPDATTAQDFINTLDAAFTALFGPDNATTLSDLGPNQGSLVKLSVGVRMLAKNYASAEESVRQMMSDFADALGQPGSGNAADSMYAAEIHYGIGPLVEVKTRL